MSEQYFLLQNSKIYAILIKDSAVFGFLTEAYRRFD